MLKTFVVAALTLVVSPAFSAVSELDGLTLPPGFHAQVVASGLGPIRYVAIRDNGDIYVSTRHQRNQPSTGIVALRLGPEHTAIQTEHFGDVDQGTGIRIYKSALYATSPTGVYRFTFTDKALVPTSPSQLVVDGLSVTSNHV